MAPSYTRTFSPVAKLAPAVAPPKVPLTVRLVSSVTPPLATLPVMMPTLSAKPVTVAVVVGGVVSTTNVGLPTLDVTALPTAS